MIRTVPVHCVRGLHKQTSIRTDARLFMGRGDLAGRVVADDQNKTEAIG